MVCFLNIWVSLKGALQEFQVAVQVPNGMFLFNDLGGFQVCLSNFSGDLSGVHGMSLNAFNRFQECLSNVSSDRSGVQWYIFKWFQRFSGMPFKRFR